MNSIVNISTVSTPMPLDLAKKIGLNGVDEVLCTFWKGYDNMIHDPAIHIDASFAEDDITTKWYDKILEIWDSRNRAITIVLNTLKPFYQFSDNTLKKKRGKAPTIDFCFKDWNNTSYFGAECKNLYKNDHSKIKRYVETGVDNYSSGRYGSGSSENSIIGYVLSGDIPTIVSKITNEMAKTGPISNLSRVARVIEPQYVSEHTRNMDNKTIKLHHLFFDFT